MDSEFRYFFTKKAADDLDEILGYISFTLCNPTAAENFYNMLSDSVNQLCSFPEIGSLVSNPLVYLSGVRRLFIKNYTLYYVLDNESKEVVILRIIYSHRNLDEIILALDW